ncbi:AraC family transcriptional regulator [Bacillus sp. FJAT-27264]|uniref:AraC family transcriptional regulator n=1 Tax=Paenibacillus sp. (strain DSM 101736 / FJAT-27264) TaxID=1850362 RepID=UPI000807C929|nr:AraC family transcriptional regulator [Bacillus sp. FJAT-27264]OBZ07588.1 AraC family transcriptional regulator [Bacillus sp. FJAT-27264]
MSNSRVVIDRRFDDLIEKIGISTIEALKKSDLPEDLFTRPISSLTAIEYIRFMEALKELSIDECAPIKIGTLESIETFSPPVFAAYCSKNALTCMKRIATYKKLTGPLVFLINENRDYITLEIVFENEEHEIPEFLTALEMVFLVQLMRNATKTHIIPLEVMTKHKIDHDDYEKFFGVRPKIGPRNVLTISKQDALCPFISQNDAMWEYFEPELRRRLNELDVDDTYAARVRSALTELLPAGEGSIDNVSSKLGCSKRTLQRKLNEENTTFQKQLNHTRELLARHYLKNSGMLSDEIAYLLGYQDLNSFVRAFHSWTGMTISEYKRQ